MEISFSDRKIMKKKHINVENDQKLIFQGLNRSRFTLLMGTSGEPI